MNIKKTDAGTRNHSANSYRAVSGINASICAAFCVLVAGWRESTTGTQTKAQTIMCELQLWRLADTASCVHGMQMMRH